MAKLLLVEDVEHLGRKGEVVSVRPGFARNFLFPKGFAVTADTRALRMQQRLQEERQAKALQDKEESEQLAASMVGAVVTTTVKVDHDGHMYGSVTAADIAKMLHEQANLTIDKHHIALKHPYKEVGVFECPIKLKEGVVSSVTVKIVPEEQEHQKVL
jgi:large subunit ribosomal protein L9